MLKDEIIEKAKQKPFRVYFDMDGVCSEERTGEHDLIVANAKDFYLKKRPMKTMLRVMQELHDAGGRNRDFEQLLVFGASRPKKAMAQNQCSIC